MMALPAWQTRILAVALLLGVFAAVYYGVFAPIADTYQATQQRIAQLHLELARYEQVGRALSARRSELAALKRHQSAQDGFLQGPSDTLVAAQIQNRLKQLVTAVQGELNSTQILPAQPDGNVRRITVRGQMTASIGGMLRIFHDLESGYPLLFLDNVDIRARPSEMRDGAAPSTLEVQFDVYGYRRGKAG